MVKKKKKRNQESTQQKQKQSGDRNEKGCLERKVERKESVEMKRGCRKGGGSITGFYVDIQVTTG